MAAKNEKVGVGVIGVGIGSFHIQGYQQCPEAEVVAVCDLNEARAKATAEQYSIPNVYSDYNEMLKREDIDAVSVCTPNFLHAPISIAAFEAGKHVICEKPLAMNPQEGEAMVAASKKAGKLFMTAFNNRFRGDTQVLKKFIENGDLGEIYFGKTGWIRRKGIPGMGGWFTTKSKSGGGPLIDIGVHVLDLALWLMGNPKAVTVTGTTYAKFGPKGEGTGGWGIAEADGSFDVEDLASGFIRLDTGATLMLEASWASHIKQDMIYTSLCGTKGGADVDPLRIYTDINGVPSDITPSYPQVAGHIMEIKHFVDCLVNGTELISTGEHGLEVVRILDAIYKSAATGKEISLK
ncbi:MAG: Gfo/Idh/MocA family protein [Armatimonadota bacterium]